ncbi:MAG TPA: cupin domain-containing protein [Bryobacteraceae bacterium]|nr:cupin domain-containing protein [Bryobacteraceae bacterium]
MKRSLRRRSFIGAAGITAGAAWVGLKTGLTGAAFAADAPDEVLNPVEVSGEEAVPIMGRLPGAKRMYVLPAGSGEHHLIGGFVMTRISRPADTANVYEMATFAGKTGAAMPRHLHRGSHCAFLVLGGEVELELNGQRWLMMRGDFANIPPGTPHAWTMRSDRSKIALFSMNDRVGNAFIAMGKTHESGEPPDAQGKAVPAAALAAAADNGDFQVVQQSAPAAEPRRVSNLTLPFTPGTYVLHDGGGERFGGNTFLAKNANTMGQFLFLMTEGGPSTGVPAHFHARHFENFFGMDGETLGWAYGKAVSLKAGDYFQAPPRNLHGFKLTQSYNRFAAFLTPGIFENFFTGGKAGQNGVGGRAEANAGVGPGGGVPGAPPSGRVGSRGGPSGRGGVDIFRMLMMSNTGPDGYPLDVHGPTKPLPPQDPVWTAFNHGNQMAQRAQLLAHGLALCGAAGLNREITPELRKALALKPKPEDFV